MPWFIVQLQTNTVCLYSHFNFVISWEIFLVPIKIMTVHHYLSYSCINIGKIWHKANKYREKAFLNFSRKHRRYQCKLDRVLHSTGTLHLLTETCTICKRKCSTHRNYFFMSKLWLFFSPQSFWKLATIINSSHWFVFLCWNLTPTEVILFLE